MRIIDFVSNSWWHKILLIICCFSFSISCKSKTKLAQDPDIQVYFNHRAATRYKDPYRQIKRSGDNLEAVIIEAIAQANSTIDLAVQELQLPLVAQALAKQAAKGIKIRVILEHQYSQPISELSSAKVNDLDSRAKKRYQQYFRLIDHDNSGVITKQEAAQYDSLVILRDAGITIIDDTADGSKGSGLMHHKFMVIDGQTIITGSANYTLSGVHGDLDSPQTRGNANHLLVINNAQVAQHFTTEFNHLWGENAQPRFGLAKPYRQPVSVNWENTQLTLQFAPTSSKQDWTETTNGLVGQILDKATNSVDLALFVFSEQELVDILEDKQQERVKIRGLVDKDFIFRSYSEALDLLGVEMLSKCKAEPENNPWQQPLSTIGQANLATGDKLHHKLALIDDDTVITGSQNWSAAANYTNDEALLIIENATVAKHFQQEFERLYQDAQLGLTPAIEAKLARRRQACD